MHCDNHFPTKLWVYSSISNKTKLAQKLYESGYFCLQAFTESVLFISTHLKFQSRRLMYWPPFIPMLNENVSYGPAFIHPNNKSNILFLCICIYVKNELL